MNGCDTQKIQEVLEYKHNVVLDIDEYFVGSIIITRYIHTYVSHNSSILQ